MMSLPALLITLEAVKQDTAIQTGGRGARKILVTELYPQHEDEATKIEWMPASAFEKCPVLVTPDIEVAIFTQHAAQDRHRHHNGTEFYSVIEGRMAIEIGERTYVLEAGDMIAVLPGTVHQVMPDETTFLCRVISVNCGGIADKYIEKQSGAGSR